MAFPLKFSCKMSSDRLLLVSSSPSWFNGKSNELGNRTVRITSCAHLGKECQQDKLLSYSWNTRDQSPFTFLCPSLDSSFLLSPWRSQCTQHLVRLMFIDRVLLFAILTSCFPSHHICHYSIYLLAWWVSPWNLNSATQRVPQAHQLCHTALTKLCREVAIVLLSVN